MLVRYLFPRNRLTIQDYCYNGMRMADVIVWHIGDVIQKLREAYVVDKATGRCGLSRKELADKAGIRPDTLGELERNVSNFEQGTLAKVAVALNVTIEGLYAQIPGVSLPVTTDPVDAETIARFLKLEADQKLVVRKIIDQLGLFPDRQRAVSPNDAAQNPESTPRSGT